MDIAESQASKIHRRTAVLGLPENDSRDCHSGIEVNYLLVVAGRNASAVFQSAERPLDQVSADLGECVVGNAYFAKLG